MHTYSIRLDRLADLDFTTAGMVARSWVKSTYGVECGIEYIGLADGTELAYVNRGDTYDETLCYHGGEWSISCWGQFVEDAEGVRESTGERRCQECGEWIDTHAICDCGAFPDSAELMLSDGLGIYLPQTFAHYFMDESRAYLGNHWTTEDLEDLKILEAGPEHEHYWDAWDTVLQDARMVDAEGNTWALYQDGDLFRLVYSEGVA